MDRTVVFLSCALALVIVGVGGFVYWTTRDKRDAALSADESLVVFTNLCTTNVISRGATKFDNTVDQIKSACKCLGEDFREELAGLTSARVGAFLDSAPGDLRMRASAIKCFRRAGLDFRED